MALPPYKLDPLVFRAATVVYHKVTGPAPAKGEGEQLTHANVFLHNHLTNTGQVLTHANVFLHNQLTNTGQVGMLTHGNGVYQKPNPGGDRYGESFEASEGGKTGGKGTNSEWCLSWRTESSEQTGIFRRLAFT
jgi:hypothetical protein